MGHSDPNLSSMVDSPTSRESSVYASDHNRLSRQGSPMMMSPWNPFPQNSPMDNNLSQNRLIGSLVRQEGHIYSLGATGDLLYTGSDSKNIRVWKNMKESSAFKSNSGFVKAVIISGEKIFTGHQDGKVRIWKLNTKNPTIHKRVGSLPNFFHILKCSIKPSNYVQVKRHKSAVWIKHCDAISCLSMDEEHGLLYSASWDRTFKVWRVDNSKCIESVKSHDDAVNSIVVAGDGMVFTGSADGTVKVWKREGHGKLMKHKFVQTLLKQECAVTSLALSGSGSVIYCGSSDGLVNFWEREKHLSHGGILKGHKLAVLCLAAAGNMMFSGSADKTICVWRMEGTNHVCTSVLTGHNGPVKCLAVDKDQESADDQRLIVYSGSLDKSVKVWSVSELSPPCWDINSITSRQF